MPRPSESGTDASSGSTRSCPGVRSRVTVDAGGATLTPGFHDAHCHTTSFGLGLVHLELDKVVGIGPTLEAVAAYADGLGTDEWVIGFGFGSGLPHDQYPDRDELDRAAGGRPVWLTHLSGHSCVVSSAALEAVGVTGALDGTGRGRVVVDDDGRPTGLIEESAMDLIKDHVGPSSIDRLADAIDRATAHYLTEGITGFTDAGIGCPGIDHSPVELAAYQLAHSTGRLHTRARLMAYNELFHPLRTHPDDRIATGLDLGVRTGFGDDWLSLGAMKVWIDGSGLGHTAATTDADGRVVGGFDNDPGALRQSIIDAHRGGWQVACHTIGDAALDLVLDALEEAATGGPYPARAGTVPRHRIEHGVMVRPDQVARLARLRMTVVVQPLFVSEFGDPLIGLAGGDRWRGRLLSDAQPGRRRRARGGELGPARGRRLSASGDPGHGRTQDGHRSGLRLPANASRPRRHWLPTRPVGPRRPTPSRPGEPSAPADWPTWSCWKTTPPLWTSTASVASEWWRR